MPNDTLTLIPIGGDHQAVTIEPAPRTVLGRSALADLVIEHRAVSRTHCRLDADPGDDGSVSWLVRDLGSRQGTTVNGHKLEAGVPVPLQDRDTLTLGPLVYRVDLSGGGFTIAPTTLISSRGAENVRSMPAREREPLTPSQAALIAGLVAELVACDDLETTCQRVADAAVQGSRFSSASVLRSLNGQPELITHVGKGEGEPTFSSTLLARADETREAVFLSGDADALRSVSVVSLDIRSAVCVPLITDGSSALMGWLYLDSRGGAAPTTPSAEFFRVLGRITGMAIGNLERRAIERRSADLESEARAARAVQQLCQPPLSGSAGGLEYAVHWRPSRYTAGDLFDLLKMDDGSVAFCVGDAVGKGLAAGYLASSIVPALRLAIVNGFGVAQAVTSLGACLPWHNDGPTRFLTLWLGALDANGRTLRYVDAGHGHAYLHRPGARVERIDGQGGPPLGVVPDCLYSSGELELQPGDRLILLSDGVLELANRDGQQIGETVFEPDINQQDPQRYADELLARADAYAQGMPFQDDATVAVFTAR